MICVVPIGSTCRAARCGTLRHVAAKTTTQCAVWRRVQRRGFGVNAALRVLTINDGRRDRGATVTHFVISSSRAPVTALFSSAVGRFICLYWPWVETIRIPRE